MKVRISKYMSYFNLFIGFLLIIFSIINDLGIVFLLIGAFAVLGEMYYRHGGGRRDFNMEPGTLSSSGRKGYGSDELGDVHRIAPMVKVLWQLPTQRNIVFEAKAAWHDMNYNQSYSGVSTADFNADPYQQYVALQLGEYNTEQFTYYGKVRAELNSNIKNTTTLYYNLSLIHI